LRGHRAMGWMRLLCVDGERGCGKKKNQKCG
jgi:hypothetical protein